MAITVTDRGTAAISTNATTGTFSPASNFAAGSWAVCCIGLNNSNTNGTAYSIFTITDSLGNTWTKRISPLNDPALVNAGVEAAIFTTSMDGGTLTTGTTITITTNVATVARVVTLMEVIPTGGSTIGYVTGASSTDTSSTPSIFTGSITSGNIVVAAVFVEFGSDLVITQDGDTTNGSWSAQQTTTVGGSLLTGLSMASQRKVVTATATQTYNPTLSSSEDLCIGWIELNETGGGGGGLIGDLFKPFKRSFALRRASQY